MEEVPIYPLKLLCRNICNFPTNIFFWFFHSGVTVIYFVLQTTPEEKSQGLRFGERAGQIPLLINLTPKTSDKACIDMCSVGSSRTLLKPAIESSYFCELWEELPKNDVYITFAIIFLLKNTGPTILLALTAHQTPTFTGWSRTSWVRCGFCEL
jgi:hypothetical protein